MGKRKTNFGESAMLNNFSWRNYYTYLTELATSMFEWEGLPPEIDERFLETSLFYRGKVAFFWDDALGDYLALPFTLQGRYDVYRNPIKIRAFADNGYNATLDKSEFVPIYNNYVREPSSPVAMYYAQRLWDLDRTIDINARAQKTPIFIQAPETQRLTMTNLYKEYDGNSPVIYGDTELSSKPINVISTEVKFVARDLYELRTQIWNEALTRLGISNFSVEKKAQLISDEVTRNQGGTANSRYSRLRMREMACENINRVFGINVSVSYAQENRELVPGSLVSGVELDGDIK